MKFTTAEFEKCKADFLKCNEVCWYNTADSDADIWLSINAVDWLEEGFFCMENMIDGCHRAFEMRFLKRHHLDGWDYPRTPNKQWWYEYRQLKRYVEKWSKKLNHYPKSRFEDGYNFKEVA